ncbi:hypothetical protein [Haloarcula nitratireducens]|uniref:Exonuclease RecJ n=1 Tax=Haloarcula nitratireducens TaxID=2487749 RepID=A0AAW4PA64_9EURY|nr:hypothetical protein [Halomicroarcula nitratireducens]MBX0294698.1 hypothetical protein [Halomicroarcula nitratireducens]
MSATGREQPPAAAPGDVAATLAEAAFVRLVSDATGDALAGTGVLARALDAAGTPFQASVVAPFADPDRTTDADVTVSVGRSPSSADHALSSRPAATAFEIARELGTAAASPLALAGTIAGGELDGSVAEAAEQAGLERRPGLAIPTADLADGLAHSTLFRAPFSGDEERTRATLAELDLPAEPTDDDHRRVASLVALAVTGADDAPPRAADAVQRGLRPYAGGPFETIGGYADVLDAVARERPGVGVALALGHDGVREDALSAWRTHARRAHTAVSEATTGRYDGLFVARGDAMPVGTVARLAADFRAPEPVTLVVTDGEAAARATDGRDLTATMRAAADAVGGRAVECGDCVRARFDVSTADLIEAFREAL